ncbi:MAG: ATPase [Chloroflexota bacterium]|nr:ATPase [Chloroflexota bacterium]
MDPASWANLGGALALAGGLLGSAIGIGIAASAGLATLSEDSSQFRNVIILSSLPMTQSFYGLIVMILVLTSVIPNVSSEGGSGFMVLGACLIATFAFAASAIYQGSVCASGNSLLPKTKGGILTSSMMLAVFVELIAVLGLVFTIMAFTLLGVM